jgi:hypothetical protein
MWVGWIDLMINCPVMRMCRAEMGNTGMRVNTRMATKFILINVYDFNLKEEKFTCKLLIKS